MATAKTLGKLRESGSKQFNVWLPAATLETMRRLKESRGETYGELIASAMAGLAGAEPTVEIRTNLDSGLESRIAALEATLAALIGRSTPPMTVPAVVKKPDIATPAGKWDKQIAAARLNVESSLTGQHPPIPTDLKPAYRRALELFDAGETLARQISKKLANEGHVSKGRKPISATIIIKLLQDNGRLKRETAI